MNQARQNLLKALLIAVASILALGTSHVSGADPSATGKIREILVFGGNGLLGSSVVHRLIEGGGTRLTLVNRGNWYWDSKERIRPHVDWISCDRKNGVESCAELVQVVKRLKVKNEKFAAVLDFSAYSAKETRDALDLLQGRADLYVHISTDSVYDVADPGAHHHEDPSWSGCREEEAVRPSDAYTRDLLSKHFFYANNKLEAEEVLVEHRKNGTSQGKDSIPYVILRLPDVLGPRDTTFRFWTYQVWIRLTSELPQNPVGMPAYLVGYNNSFVYVEDVARVICDVILTSSANSDVRDQIYNLAWPQNITLDGFIRDLAVTLKLVTVPEQFNVTVWDNTKTTYFYPTVRRGPIDPSKATRLLGWRPTPWHEAIAETVVFYDTAMREEQFRTQREEIVQIAAAQVYADQRKDFYLAMEKIYGIDLSHYKGHDEL